MRKKFGKLKNTLIEDRLFETKKGVRSLSNRRFSKNIIFGNDIYMDINAGIETYKKSNFLYGDMDDIRECFIEPNILQMNMSYIVKDYDGILYATYREVFEDAGYTVKVINFIDFLDSDRFNVFEYFNYEQDVTMFVKLVIDAYTTEISNSERLVKNAEKYLLEAILYYIMTELPHKEHNMKTVFRLLELARPYERATDEYMSDLDMLFRDIDIDEEYSIAYDKYMKFLSVAEHIERMVIENVERYLSLYNVNSTRTICNEDEVKLDDMVGNYEILFVVVPRQAKEYEKLADIFMYQAIMYMDYIAEKKYKGKLPNPVHIMAPGMITTLVDIAIKNCNKRNFFITLGTDSLLKSSQTYPNIWELIESCSAFVCYNYDDTEIRDFMKKYVITKYNNDVNSEGSLDPNLNIELEDYMEMDDVDCIICLQYIKAICADSFEPDRMEGYVDVSAKEMNSYMDSVEQALASQIYSNLLGAITARISSVKVGENVNIDIASKKLISDRIYDNITMKVSKDAYQ